MTLERARELLAEVAGIIDERAAAYGPPEKNLSDIAAGWSVLFGVEVDARAVCRAMVWVKLCRDLGSRAEDNVRDVLGYGSLMSDKAPGPKAGQVNGHCPDGQAHVWKRVNDACLWKCSYCGEYRG